MSFRMISVATLALALFVSAAALAAQAPVTHDGKLVSITSDKLVMSGKDGKEHSHALTAAARLVLDGKACTAADLKSGTKIRVTTQGEGNSVVSRIEGLDKNSDFASTSQDGKVVSITGNKLVLTLAQGSEAQTYTLATNASVTCDGKVCKAADLKPGMKVRVTFDSASPYAATRVEAIEKNLDFASL